jgi:hypothetical protein
MTWAITKRPTFCVASTYDPRNPDEYPSKRILAGAKQDGTEHEPTLVRLVKAFEKWEAGPLVDECELVFMQYELQAAIQAFHQAHPKE